VNVLHGVKTLAMVSVWPPGISSGQPYLKFSHQWHVCCHRYNAEQAHVWIAGVMLYAMVVGKYPFENHLPHAIAWPLLTERPLQNLPPGLTAECRELLEGMLHPNKDERMTVKRIKQHPWFLRCVCGLQALPFSRHRL
jgi:serine/threonine protein kinase